MPKILVKFKRDTGEIIQIDGFDRMIPGSKRNLYLSGKVYGIIDKDYTLKLCDPIPNLLESQYDSGEVVFGDFVLTSVRDNIFEFTKTDFKSIRELFYTFKGRDVIVTDDFFLLASELGEVAYDNREVSFFINHGYCNHGTTIFEGILRIPPGKSIHFLQTSGIRIDNELDRFDGPNVSYDEFRKILFETINKILTLFPQEKNVVLLSGGIDSTVLLAMVKGLRENTIATTMRFIPRNIVNSKDIKRSERAASFLNTEHQYVDIDFKNATINDLEKIVYRMPFAAHLGVDFIDLFQSLSNRNVLAWCGQNCDSIYNLGPTDRYAPIHRFLISSNYIRMLKGIYGSDNYLPIKRSVDFLIHTYYAKAYGKEVVVPKNFHQLREYFMQSNQYLALSSADNPVITLEVSDSNFTYREAEKTLFDDKLGSFFTGRDNKIVSSSAAAAKVAMVMPYSMDNMIPMFRNLSKGWRDVLFPKRYLYRYATKDLGLPKRFWQNEVKIDEETMALHDFDQFILNSTTLGEQLKGYIKEMSKLKSSSRIESVQNALSMYWIASLNPILEKRGVVHLQYSAKKRNQNLNIKNDIYGKN